MSFFLVFSLLAFLKEVETFEVERRDGKMMKKLHSADRERVYLLNSMSTCRMFLLLQDRADERDHRSV